MQLIGICGTARAGKTSAANFITGQMLQNAGMTDKFEIDEDGKLSVESDIIGDNGQVSKEMRPFSAKNTLRDPEFELWAKQQLWPNVKVYSLADPLKYWLIDTFGLTYDQVFGSGKYDGTDITWESVKFLPMDKKYADKTGIMTAREVMVVFGTGFIRSVSKTTFVDAAIRRIKDDNPQVAIIDDVRADFEAKEIQDNGGIIVKLTRGDKADMSEKSINKVKPDFGLDNKNMDMDLSHFKLKEFIFGA